MNIRCRRDALHRAVQTIAGVVDPRNIKPVLQDICFRAQDGRLELAATDLEVGMRYNVADVEVIEEGAVVVRAQLIAGILRESPDEEINLETDGTTCYVIGTDSKFRLSGEAVEEFPDIPSFPEGKCLEVDGLVLCEMVQRTRFAVAPVRSTYALNGALWVMQDGKKDIEMVGADGRRLARIRRKARKAAAESARAIIPLKALQQIEKMVSADTAEAGPEAPETVGVGAVRMRIEERRIIVDNGVCTLVAQLVEGRYPDYDEVIPTDCDKKVELPRESFLSGLRRVALMASHDNRAVCFSLSAGRLAMNAAEAETGEANVELSVGYDGPDTEMLFNPDYLIDMLRVCDDETVFLEFKSPRHAVLLKSPKDYLYLVMPITREDA